LLQNSSNPFVELNYAIALFFSGEKGTAFKIVNDLRQKPSLKEYHPLNAALGKLNFLTGNYSEAKKFYSETLGQIKSPAEKDFILSRIARIEEMKKIIQN
jgi:RNA polymerase sigma-70 factor (ECF subfamily)